jgi:hypothetical protein
MINGTLIIVNNELERIWQEATVVYLKIQSDHFKTQPIFNEKSTVEVKLILSSVLRRMTGTTEG